MVVIWPVMVKICSAIGDLRVVMGDVWPAIGELRVVMGDVWPAIDNLMPDMLYKIYFFIYIKLI